MRQVGEGGRVSARSLSVIQTDGGTETEGRHTEADNSISIRQITACFKKSYIGLMHWYSS